MIPKFLPDGKHYGAMAHKSSDPSILFLINLRPSFVNVEVIPWEVSSKCPQS